MFQSTVSSASPHFVAHLLPLITRALRYLLYIFLLTFILVPFIFLTFLIVYIYLSFPIPLSIISFRPCRLWGLGNAYTYPLPGRTLHLLLFSQRAPLTLPTSFHYFSITKSPLCTSRSPSLPPPSTLIPLLFLHVLPSLSYHSASSPLLPLPPVTAFPLNAHSIFLSLPRNAITFPRMFTLPPTSLMLATAPLVILPPCPLTCLPFLLSSSLLLPSLCLFLSFSCPVLFMSFLVYLNRFFLHYP